MKLYCEKCLNNSHSGFIFQKKRDEDQKWTEAECKQCGTVIEFGFKKRKVSEGAVTKYEVRDGKRFLEIDGLFQEVGVYKLKKGIKVMPINNYYKEYEE